MPRFPNHTSPARVKRHPAKGQYRADQAVSEPARRPRSSPQRRSLIAFHVSAHAWTAMSTRCRWRVPDSVSRPQTRETSPVPREAKTRGRNLPCRCFRARLPRRRAAVAPGRLPSRPAPRWRRSSCCGPGSRSRRKWGQREKQSTEGSSETAADGSRGNRCGTAERETTT